MTLLRSSLFALALLLITPPYAFIALATFPLPRLVRSRIISGWSRLVVWLACVLCGIRWRVEGAEHIPQRPAVVLAKHQSAWETMAFQLIFPPQAYLLKRELLWIPFFGWGLALTSPISSSMPGLGLRQSHSESAACGQKKTASMRPPS